MSDTAAQNAAPLWGLAPDRVTLVARRENAVYRAENNTGSYALRLHRPGYRTTAQLQSELDWMAALANRGMAVPRPIPMPSGEYIAEVDGYQVDVLTWLPGRMLGHQGQFEGITDRPGLARKLGQTLAQLHDLSDIWTPPDGFARPVWDRAGLTGPNPLWGRFWEHPDLTATQRATFERVRDVAGAHLARIEGELDYGLIHADAITENIMVDNGALYLIDFDDGGWGFRDFDLATFLMRQIDAPDFRAIRTALIDGYSIRRRIENSVLDLMLLLRALTYPGWIIPRLHEPGGKARSDRALATALPLAQAYLNGDPS